MKSRSRMFAARVAAVVLVGPVVLARETYLLSANSFFNGAEIQGANGWIARPGIEFPSIAGTVKGVAAQGATGYVLTQSGFGSISQSLVSFDMTTGATLSTTPLSLPTGDPGIQDIAVLNGTVYGAWGAGSPGLTGTTVKIKQIGNDGSLTDVFSLSGVTTQSPKIAASTQANSVVLLPLTGFSNYLRPTSTYLINPSNWTVTQSVSGTVSVNSLAVLSENGQQLIQDNITSSNQTVRSVPGFATQQTYVYPNTLGHSVPIGPQVSDGFDLPYASSLPAVVELRSQNQTGIITGSGVVTQTISQNGSSTSSSYSGSVQLFRRGTVSWGADVAITNYATPDNTSVDQVAVTGLTWNQSSGSAISVSTTINPVGDLSTRAIAHTDFSLDANTASRGSYSISAATNLQGRYTTGPDESVRSLQTNFNPLFVFAIDPVSSNLVGNGGFELTPLGQAAGWTGGFATQDSGVAAKPNVLSLNPFGSIVAKASESLELGTPDQPMLFSFDIRVSSGGINMLVKLDGMDLGTISNISSGSTYQTFSIPVTDPKFENLTNPLLEFDATSLGSGSASFYLDNVSLTAVPEPSVVGLLVCGAIPALLRRRGRVSV